MSDDDIPVTGGVDGRLAAVHAQVADALVRSGRRPGAVEVVAVSKKIPPSRIREAWDAGQTRFGESRVQELAAKAPELPASVEWHFIGHIQTNKIRKLLPLAGTLHSIDSLEVATQTDRIAAELGLFPTVYLEVNIGNDASKFGFSPSRLEADLDHLLALERLEIVGLMTIPPFSPDPAASRPHFARLRILRDRLATTTGTPLNRLSMGMSNDFPIAIEEGATTVRIGSAILGQRS